MRFLSDEWFAALGEAIGQPGDAAPAPHLVVSHRVPDGPDGAVGWVVEVTHGATRLRRAPDHEIASADVRFEHDYATAAAISRGDLSAQSAFILGRLRVTGDVTRLVDARDGLDTLAGRLDAVRDRTEY